MSNKKKYAQTGMQSGARNTFSVDEELDAPFDWKHMKRVFVYIKRYKSNFIKMFAASGAGMLLSRLTPML